MNHLILDVIFVAVAAAIVLISTARGFLRNFMKTVRVILAFFLAYSFGGKVGELLYDKFVYNWIYNGIYGKMEQLYTDASGSLGVENALSSIPSFLRTAELEEKLASISTEGEAGVVSFSETISRTVAHFSSNVIGYVSVFLVSFLLIWLFTAIFTSLIEKIKLLKRVNRFLGFVWGVVVAFVVLLVAASLIKVFFGENEIYTQSVVVRFFGDSALLEAFQVFNVGRAWLNFAID